MEESNKHRVYEPPRAKDLSLFTVTGAPLGVCKSGSYPYFACNIGSDYNAICSAGANVDTSACNPLGGYHAYPACRPGSNASTTCVVGTAQQF